MSPRMKVYGSALALFLAGAVAGGFGSELAARGQPNPGDGGPSMGREGGGMRHGQMGERIQEHLTKKLNLTSDQQEQLRKIVSDAKPQFQQLHEKHQGERRELMQSVGDKIRNILTSDQQKQFDELRQKMKERMEHKREGGGDGDGGPGHGFFKHRGGFRGEGQ